MPKFEKRFVFVSFLFLTFFFSAIVSLHALDAGFAISSKMIFLKRSENPYYPQVIPSFDASFFFKHSFVFKNGSLDITPGFFVANEYNPSRYKIDKMTVLPYFKRLNLSVFAETFSFYLAKASIAFGEGFFDVNNYYFLHLPTNNSNEAFYHAVFEISAKECLFNFGSTLDTYALDRYKKPEWYSIWLSTSYSNTLMTLGLASDVLVEEKDVTLHFAYETSFFLPYDFKIYSSCSLPVNLKDKKITEWGVFVGANKSFIFDDYAFISILGASYGYDRFGYSVFQNVNIKEIVSFVLGLQGKGQDALNFFCSGELFISTFSFKLTYITQNLFETETTHERTMRGLLKLGVSFNDN